MDLVSGGPESAGGTRARGEALAWRTARPSRPLTWRGGRWCVRCWCGLASRSIGCFLTLHRIIVDRASLHPGRAAGTP